MDRRSFLIGLGTAGTAGGVGACATGMIGDGELQTVVDETVGGDPLVDTARLNSHIDRLEWSETGELEIYFDSSDADAWSIHHADTEPNVQQTLVDGETPRFEGPARMDFQAIVNAAGYEFPSREFQITLWDADTSDEAGLITGAAFEVAATYSFEVPEESGIVV